ncbi:hypothetical protein LL963_17415 [Xanthomonas campestris pv. esculenti]|nr:hypothetical protein [Xanthomonas campestris pv. esculenti]
MSPLSNFRLRHCLPLGLLGALCACTGTPSAPRPEAEHFTVAELQQLGCTLTDAPKRTVRKIPLLGEVDGYGVTNTNTSASACATHLISLLQPMTYEDGVWEGARSAAGTFAKEHGFVRESYEGRIGEYSEIEVFNRGGKPVGFEYNVQARGTLHSVIVLSDSIAPDAAFEAVMKTKL